LRTKRLSKIIVHSNKLIKKPRIETIVIEDTQPEIIEIPDTQPPTIIIPDSQPSTIIIPDTQPPTIVIPDTQPQIIEILDTQPIKTIEIPDTQQTLDSMLENDFGMDNEFGDTSLKALLDFFDNKNVVVNNHYVWWRLVRIWKISSI
jgi:hypothetical protein